jgi:hypothetical protein
LFTARLKDGDGSLLAVPNHVRGAMRDGDTVQVSLEVLPEQD